MWQWILLSYKQLDSLKHVNSDNFGCYSLFSEIFIPRPCCCMPDVCHGNYLGCCVVLLNVKQLGLLSQWSDSNNFRCRRLSASHLAFNTGINQLDKLLLV